MTWSYSGVPVAGTVDEIRFLIGDVVIADQLLQNEEISYAMTAEPTVYLASAICCEAIAALYGRLADSTVDAIQQSMSQKCKQYRERAVQMRRQAAIQATPTFGGISQSVKNTLNQNTDGVQPVFQKGQDDIPGGGGLNGNKAQDPYFEGF